MKRATSVVIFGLILLLATSALRTAPAGAEDLEKVPRDLPHWYLHPRPQKLTARKAAKMPVEGASIFIPDGSHEKVRVIAEYLKRRMKLYFGVDMPVKQTGKAPRSPLALVVAKKAPAWNEVAGKADLEPVPQLVLRDSYWMEIDGSSVAIAAFTHRGLLYGTQTLWQLADEQVRRNKKVLPGIRIVDWPCMRTRAFLFIHNSWKEPVSYAERALILGGELKYNMYCIQVSPATGVFRYRPELPAMKTRVRNPDGKLVVAPPMTPDRYRKEIVDLARSTGIEVVPMLNLSQGHARNLAPYLFYRDNRDYFETVDEMLEELLELFNPRTFHLGMDEELFTETKHAYPVRTMEEFQTAVVRFSRYLRRRGVSPMMWADVVYNNPKSLKTYRFAEMNMDYYEYMKRFPRDLVLVPWPYYPYKFPEVDHLAKTGLRTISAGYWGHCMPLANHVAELRTTHPNVDGLMGTMWKGLNEQRRKLWRFAPTMWNHATQTGPPDVEQRARMWKAKEPFRRPIDRTPMGLEILPVPDPPGDVDDAMKRLADPKWEVWPPAREQLVVCGPPVAPMLLRAMADAKGGLRERIEGVLARIARDARQGETLGELDYGAVAPWLEHDEGDVRGIAAEVLASAANGAARGPVVEGLDDAKSFAACARALTMVNDRAGAPKLLAALNDTNAAPDDRAAAAWSVGRLGIKEAGATLLAALETEKSPKVLKAYIWALVLLRHSGADGPIARLLESGDATVRLKAVAALGALESPKVDLLVPWISRPNRTEMEAAIWAVRRVRGGEKVMELIKAAMATQKDPGCKAGLDRYLNPWKPE